MKAPGKRSGQIIPKGERKWLVRVYIGRDGQGKRKYRSQLVHGGKKDADKKLTELLQAKNDGVLTVRPKETLNEYLDTWLDTVAKPSVRARTLVDYTRVLDSYVRPHVGAARLANLSPVEVRAMLVKLSERYSPRTTRMAHEVLRNALEQAVADRLIRDNPARARLVKKALPQKTLKEPVTVLADDVGTFLDAVKGERLEAFFVLQLFAGLRPSEALALRWSDVNGNTISVTRVLVDRTKQLHFAPPKSKTSRRAVVVPDIVVNVLREHRKRQAEERLAAGPEWDDQGLIFCTNRGEPLRQFVAQNRFSRIVKAAGLPQGLTVYSLRHSCATLLLERGIPLKIVSERLGHSTVALTGDTYSHVTRSMQEQAADALGALTK